MGKHYVVYDGKKPGVYKTWAECQEQTKGVKGADFESFDNEREAQNAYDSYINHEDLTKEEIKNSISVDVSCRPSPGVMEYRVVETKNKEVIFNSPEYVLGTNNIGEFLALVKGMQHINEQGAFERVVFYDSKTAKSWVTKKKLKTNLNRDETTEALYQEVDKALDWLKDTDINKFRLAKWKTHIFGEIEADYGRK